MSKPVANFNFDTQGLSVTFTDSSSGVPTSWSWDFGFSEGDPPVRKTSTAKNPPTVVFPSAGVYTVSLVAQNADGISDPYIFNLVVSNTPVLAMTIADMVKCDTPAGLAVDSKCFKNSVNSWQLYLQPQLSIPNEDVFNEAKWPSLANVLISKLVVYDIILDAAKSSATAQYITMKQSGGSNTTTSTTVQVADYTYVIPYGSLTGLTITVNNLIIDGISYNTSGLADEAALINWLNGLNKGHFSKNGNSIQSLANAHYITTFNITTVGTGGQGYNGTFTASNVRVEAVSSITTSSSTSAVGLGQIKSIETGPSKTEWYNNSQFWSSVFSSSGGENTSLFDNLVKDICQWAARIGVTLPMCPKLASKELPGFIVGRRSSKSSCSSTNILNQLFHGSDRCPSKG